MTKKKRTLLFAVGLIIIASIASYIVVKDIGETSELLRDKIFLLWLSSFLPIGVSAFASAFLYHYLCDSKNRWVHILWFVINTGFVVIFFSIVIRLLLVALAK